MKSLFLIADDNDDKRELLKRFVGKLLNVKILEASTTEEACRVIDEHVEFAGALIDYQMPSKNGPYVIEHLRKHNPSAKIALVTAMDSREYEEDAMNAGADAFICTSWPFDEMEERMNTMLAEWRETI